MSGPKQTKRSKECRRRNHSSTKKGSYIVDGKRSIPSENYLPNSKTGQQETPKCELSIISQKIIKERNENVFTGLQMKARKKTLSLKQKENPVSSTKKIKRCTLSWVEVCSKRRSFGFSVDGNTLSGKKRNEPVSLKTCSENIPVDDLVLLKTPSDPKLGISCISKMSFFNVLPKKSDIPLKKRYNLKSLDTSLCSAFGHLQKRNSQGKRSSEGSKRGSIPAKGTLKRKRWINNELEKHNVGYEDDIFDSAQFQIFRELLQHEESEMSCSISTPKLEFLVSPRKQKKTPVYKDCYSPNELRNYRKAAEEYHYRRSKGKKFRNAPENTIVQWNEKVPEKKKLNFSDIISNIIEMKKRRCENYEDKENSCLSQACDL